MASQRGALAGPPFFSRIGPRGMSGVRTFLVAPAWFSEPVLLSLLDLLQLRLPVVEFVLDQLELVLLAVLCGLELVDLVHDLLGGHVFLSARMRV